MALGRPGAATTDSGQTGPPPLDSNNTGVWRYVAPRPPSDMPSAPAARASPLASAQGKWLKVA